MMIGNKCIGRLAILLMLVFFSASCGSGGSGGSGNLGQAVGGAPAADAAGTVDSNGGTIEVTDPNSPIFGTKVIVPGGALDQGESVTIEINYSDVPPAALGGGAQSVSKTIMLTKDDDLKFGDLVTVVIPYDDTNLQPGDMPVVFYYDEDLLKYQSMGVKEIDRQNKTITFTTTHFSDFLVGAIAGLANSFIDVDTGFQPDVDGFLHPNYGTYDSPGGNCLGMANFAGWYYGNKKNLDGTGLYQKWLEGDPNLWQDDPTAREVIARSFMASSQGWAFLWYLTTYALGANETTLMMITAMAVTGEPQTLLFRGDNWGHAVTAYKFENNVWYIYDNNYPGEVVTLDYSPLTGFQNYSKEGGYPSDITTFGFEARATFFKNEDFEFIYDGAENGWPESTFVQINVEDPLPDQNDVLVASQADNVTITGTTTGGEVAATHLIWVLNGYMGDVDQDIVQLDADGSFSFTIPALSNPTNVLTLIATNNAGDVNRVGPSGYNGYKEYTLRVQGQSFFTNIGFESGDFTGWDHETHTWQNTTPGSFTPEKSGIVGQGSDPIAGAAISMVYSGNSSARVNNSDGSYHISTISQTTTVPNMTNPTLEFYWAAVLEDPSHPADDQPYVDITVTDDSTGSEIYHKHFYSNDPSYSGWISLLSGRWKGISWQKVQFDMSNSIGNDVTIRVEAADCGYGAHGGYVYVDGIE
jgi:hypothetical protein